MLNLRMLEGNLYVLLKSGAWLFLPTRVWMGMQGLCIERYVAEECEL